MTIRNLLRGALARLLSHRPVLGGLVAALVALPAGAAEPVFPPAASVGLVPPSGMTPAKGFAGFEHRSGASIIIVEMPPEAYGQISEKFTPEALRATGFLVKGEAEALPVAGGEGRLLRGTQSANGLTYAKWVAVAKGAAGTGLVTVQVPEAASKQVSGPAVEAALRTIAFRAKAGIAEQMAALPYRVDETAGFRPVAVFAGNGLLLTDGPKDVDPDRSQPVVIVTPSLGKVAVGPGQESAFARKALATLKDLTDVAVTDEERTTRGGSVVVRLRGTGTDAKSGRPLAMSQTMVFDGPGYLRIVAFADPDKADALARAERVAASVSPR
ncbi:MAG: hypothetical protein PGN34_00260 [Methylobacterium frigidaeris]